MVNFDNDDKEEEDLIIYLNLQIFGEHPDLFSCLPCNIEEIGFFFPLGLKLFLWEEGVFSDHFELQKHAKQYKILGINYEMFQGCYKKAYQSSEIRATFFWLWIFCSNYLISYLLG